MNWESVDPIIHAVQRARAVALYAGRLCAVPAGAALTTSGPQRGRSDNFRLLERDRRLGEHSSCCHVLACVAVDGVRMIFRG